MTLKLKDSTDSSVKEEFPFQERRRRQHLQKTKLALKVRYLYDGSSEELIMR